MLNGTFWEIASFWILVGGVSVGIYRWWVGNKRRQNLIRFPGEWKAQADPQNSVLKITAIFEIYAPHFSYECLPTVAINGRQLPVSCNLQPHLTRSGRVIAELTCGLNQIPKATEQIAVGLEVRLDDGTRTRSDFKMLNITNWPLPTSDILST